MEAETALVPINSNTIIAKEEGEDDGVKIDTDKLSYEIFSILESKFLFGYDDHKLSLSLNEAINKNISSSRTQRGKICILSIDGGGGGGMHGILPGKALSFLERSLKSKSGDPNASISDYFDLVAGTGVGGLFAAMLFSTNPASADDTWRFLVDNGKRLFPSSSSKKSLLNCLFSDGNSSGLAMEKAMKDTFPETLTLRDTVKPLLIPCYDMLTSSPLVFSRADALESESYDFRLWEVCRATWAEPGRVGPVEVRSVDKQKVCVGVDGGLAMSNPTAAAITHVLHNKQEFPFVRGLEDVMVLSLGCGSGMGSNEYCKVSKWVRKEWARPIARIGSDGSADLVDHAVAMAFGDCRSSNYLRVQANRTSMMKCGPDADSDPSPGNVKILTSIADEMLKQNNVESVLFGGKRIGVKTNMEKLESFAEQLVLEHQTRSCRIAPTVAFKQPILNSSSSKT